MLSRFFRVAPVPNRAPRLEERRDRLTGSLRRVPRASLSPVPDLVVSVVVPAYNAGGILTACLNSVLTQDYRISKVVVVDDGSTGQARSDLSSFKDSRLHALRHDRNLGLAVSLNDGIRASKGELIMIVHADCELLSPYFLRKAVADFADPRVAWVTGYHERVDSDGNFIDRAFSLLRGQDPLDYAQEPVSVPFAEGKCDIIRREVLDALGGFPTDTKWSGEDQLLSYTLRERGYVIVRDPDLIVAEHSASCSLSKSLVLNLRKEFAHGKTQAWINFRHFRTVAADLLGGSRLLSGRGRHALVKVLSGSSLVALGLAWTMWPRGTLLALLGLAVGISSSYHLKRARRRAEHVQLVDALVVAFVGIVSSVVYTLGMVWGFAVIAVQAGRPRGPL